MAGCREWHRAAVGMRVSKRRKQRCQRVMLMTHCSNRRTMAQRAKGYTSAAVTDPHLVHNVSGLGTIAMIR